MVSCPQRMQPKSPDWSALQGQGQVTRIKRAHTHTCPRPTVPTLISRLITPHYPNGAQVTLHGLCDFTFDVWDSSPLLPQSKSIQASKASTFLLQLLSNPPIQLHSIHSIATMATTDAIPVIKVLFTLHPGMDAMDFVGPLEVLTHAKHNINDECKSFS